MFLKRNLLLLNCELVFVEFKFGYRLEMSDKKRRRAQSIVFSACLLGSCAPLELEESFCQNCLLFFEVEGFEIVNSFCL